MAGEAARRNTALAGTLVTKVWAFGQIVEAQATVARGEGRVRISYTSGPIAGMQVIQQGRQVWEVGPQGVKRAHWLLREMPLVSRRQLEAGIVVRRAGRAAIANRPTSAFVVRPREDESRPLVVWLDDATHFPLAVQRFYGGEMVSETTYTSVDYSATAPPVFTPPPGADRQPEDRGGGPSPEPIAENQVEPKLGFAPRRPAYLPRGFQEQGLFLTPDANGRPFLQIRYSDGLGVLLIVEWSPKAPGEPPPGPAASPGGPAVIVERGALTAAQKALGPVTADVYAPLPHDELLRIADSLK